MKAKFSVAFAAAAMCAACVAEGEAWFPFLISYGGEANASSVAHLLDAPAGKHGFVRVVGGEFVTDAGPIRFNGTNLTGPANLRGGPARRPLRAPRHQLRAPPLHGHVVQELHGRAQAGHPRRRRRDPAQALARAAGEAGLHDRRVQEGGRLREHQPPRGADARRAGRTARRLAMGEQDRGSVSSCRAWWSCRRSTRATCSRT